MMDKGIPRTGYKVYGDGRNWGNYDGHTIANVKKNIGFALLKTEYTAEGTEVIVQVRKKKLKAVVIATPFYKR